MSKWQITILKYIAKNGDSNTEKVVINDNEYIRDFADAVFIENYLKKGFKHKIVKITNNSNRKSIYRKPSAGRGLSKEDIALSYESINQLEAEIGKVDLTISTCCFSRFKFYWNNPYYAIRISMKLGLLSILLGIISLIIAFVK